jgi:diguanylate cyclase (GGDEF)-like protein/PAS domain S-box-containing protein
LFCSLREVHLVAGKKDEQLRFQASLLEAVGQSVIATDLEGEVLYWNRAAEEIYGWSSEEALGRSLKDLTVYEEALEKAEEVGSELRAGRAWSGETLLRRKDGSYVPVLGTATPLFDDRGNVVGMIGVSTDISERNALEEQLHHQAFHDPLTGLPNRALFMDRLEHALTRANRRGTKVAVLFMDLDNFKVINDSLGHKAGDQLLIAVAERLKACLRPEDTAARLGGDEFTILVEDVAGVGDVARIAERIAEMLRPPFPLGEEVFATVSIGVALNGPAQGQPADLLLRHADLAMYRAKRRGKARYEVFEPSMDSAFTRPVLQRWRRRDNLLLGLVLIALAAVGWAYVAYQAASTGSMASALGSMQMGSKGEAALFLLAWTAMMMAMMVPATLPLILLYHTIARDRLSLLQARVGVVTLLVGYLAVWAMAGLPVYAYNSLAGAAGSLVAVLPALLLIVGGAYQFTPLKRICHARCSSPFFFLMHNWDPGATGALRLGMVHGVDCLGCCAGLMVGLVALGATNLAWMLTAAVIIFAEKTIPKSHRIARPLGVVMLSGGVVLLVTSLLGGMAPGMESM